MLIGLLWLHAELLATLPQFCLVALLIIVRTAPRRRATATRCDRSAPAPRPFSSVRLARPRGASAEARVGRPGGAGGEAGGGCRQDPRPPQRTPPGLPVRRGRRSISVERKLRPSRT